ncbi:unnamed protein product [Notodromas monacha]|uniref:C1q domain-containing protein n=1 Tax=Notodromas monacha TaxID=399045 RepID=A0A7R9BTA9_9CRUS|nr:unnamed protein product [Notodromas monacha]CAG0921353.1 unnamed protein product [Notodromas monacha]
MAKNRKKATFHWEAVLAFAVTILITRISICDCKTPANQQKIDLPDSKDTQNNPIVFSAIGQFHLPLSFIHSKRFRPEMVVLNVGHGLKPSLGYFVAPQDGIYLFNFGGLMHDITVKANYKGLFLKHMGHKEYDSVLNSNPRDPTTIAGHNLVSMMKKDALEYYGRVDSKSANYSDSLGFLHNNWWRCNGRLIADPKVRSSQTLASHKQIGKLVPFQTVHWNFGNGFNSTNGTFIAPQAGLYHFFLHFGGHGTLGQARIEKPDLVLAAGLVGNCKKIELALLHTFADLDNIRWNGTFDIQQWDKIQVVDLLLPSRPRNWPSNLGQTREYIMLTILCSSVREIETAPLGKLTL